MTTPWRRHLGPPEPHNPKSEVVETMGLEPTTPCLQSRCSSQLSYVPEGSRTRRGTSGYHRAITLPAGLPSIQPVEPVEGLGHGVQPAPPAVHLGLPVGGHLGTVVDLGDDGGVRAVGGEAVGPPQAPPRLPALLGMTPARLRLPGDQAVGLERHHVVVHLIVADGREPPRYQSRSVASAAPSARAASLAQAILGSTGSTAAKVANPQSVPAITRSRPTSSAYRTIRW